MKKMIKNIIYYFFCLFKIKDNLITFESYSGKNFSCNCKAIYDCIKKEKLNYNCKIFVKKNVQLEDNYKKDVVYKSTVRWLYYNAISKYWIKNTGAYGGLPKRKGQIYINTWHSGSILKKQGYDLDNTPIEKRIPRDNVKDWDWFVAGSKEKADVLAKSMGYNGKIVVLGMPRIDYLINFKEEEKRRIKQQLNLGNKKIILYAPTFRDDDLNGIGNVKALDKIVVPDQYIMLVKFHPFVKLNSFNYKNMINVSNYNDINELFVIADVLITDYSSVVFDYSNLKRPAILYAYDLDNYKEMRNFYIDYKKTMPGPIVENVDELNKQLLNIDSINKNYKDKQQRFYDRFCSMNDGTATKKFVELLKSGHFKKEN